MKKEQTVLAATLALLVMGGACTGPAATPSSTGASGSQPANAPGPTATVETPFEEILPPVPTLNEQQRSLGNGAPAPLSIVDGAAWSPPVNISRSSEISSYSPLIVVAPDGTSHVAWGESHMSGDRQRYASGSPERGWSIPVPLVDYDVQLSNVMLATDEHSGLHLAYRFGGRFVYRHKPKDRERWTEERPLDGFVIEGRAIPLALLVDSEGRSHVMVRSEEVGGIWHVESTESSWSVEPVYLKHVAAGIDPADVQLASLPDGELHFFWWDGDARLLRHWRKANKLWEEITGDILTDLGLLEPGESSTPRHRVSAGRDGSLHLVLIDTSQADRSEVYYARFANGVWGQIRLVSAGDGLWSLDPELTIDPLGLVHVAWRDNDSGRGGPLLYRRSYPNGQWSDIEEIAEGPWASKPAIVAGANGDLHLAWNDCRVVGPTLSPGPCQILYATLPVTIATNDR